MWWNSLFTVAHWPPRLLLVPSRPPEHSGVCGVYRLCISKIALKIYPTNSVQFEIIKVPLQCVCSHSCLVRIDFLNVCSFFSSSSLLLVVILIIGVWKDLTSKHLRINNPTKWIIWYVCRWVLPATWWFFFVCGTGAWVCKSWILKTVRDLSYKRVSGTENYGQIHCNACLFLL